MYQNNMKTYCIKCRKDTENIDSEIVRTKKNSLVLQSNYYICEIKKSRFLKEQEAKVLLSNLGIKTPFSKFPLKILINIYYVQLICLIDMLGLLL